MHMLAENCRLLHQVAEHFQRPVITLIVADLLTLPFLKRVRTTAANLYMMLVCRLQNDLLHGRKLV